MIILRILVFLAGVYVCQTNIEKHWVTGPVFGAVVLFWDWSLTKRSDVLRYAGFFASAVLIYAGVVELMRIDVPETGLGQYLIPGMLAGTVALLLAHKVFLGLGWTRLAVGIPVIYVVAYAASLIFNDLPMGIPRTFLNALGAWQVAYLAVTYPSRHTGGGPTA